MKSKIKTFLFGLIVGAIIAFPLGTNFGRGAPLLSNPFASGSLQQRVKERVKEGTEKAIESAKETIHQATKPARKDTEGRK